MRILGVTASGFFEGGDFELISTTLISSNTPSVTFNNLDDYSSKYKHLQIRMTARAAFANTGTGDLTLKINAATSNYSSHNLRGTTGTPSSTSATGTSVIFLESTFVGNSNTANIFGAAVVDILDAFSTTKNKTIRSLQGHTAVEPRVSFSSGAYYSTNPITSIEILTTGGVSVFPGSRFSIYGIRG
jgi:hypothetical protein